MSVRTAADAPNSGAPEHPRCEPPRGLLHWTIVLVNSAMPALMLNLKASSLSFIREELTNRRFRPDLRTQWILQGIITAQCDVIQRLVSNPLQGRHLRLPVLMQLVRILRGGGPAAPRSASRRPKQNRNIQRAPHVSEEALVFRMCYVPTVPIIDREEHEHAHEVADPCQSRRARATFLHVWSSEMFDVLNELRNVVGCHHREPRGGVKFFRHTLVVCFCLLRLSARPVPGPHIFTGPSERLQSPPRSVKKGH